MKQDPKDIFTKISDFDDRVALAHDVVKLKAELVCKVQAADELFRLQANRVEGRSRLICINPSGGAIPPQFPVSAVISFSIGSEKYFMITQISNLGGGYFEFDFASEIFHLQRRQSYRIRIPEHERSLYEIVKLNSSPSTISGGVFDVSTGGVRLIIPHDRPLLKIDDIVEGVLKPGPHEQMSFKGQVRHLKIERDDSGAHRQIVGIEFKDMTAGMESRLFSIVMELHRELLTRWE